MLLGDDRSKSRVPLSELVKQFAFRRIGSAVGYPERTQRSLTDELYLRNDVYDVPQIVQAVYRETLAAVEHDLPTLAGIGIRAILEATCQDLKAKKRDLKRSIDALVDLSYMTLSGAEILHSIRSLGNEAAHDMKAPTTTQIRAALKVLDHLLLGVYVLPQEAAVLPKPKAKSTAQPAAKGSKKGGVIPIRNVEVWSHPVPQDLIFPDLSNQNHRLRLAKANAEDVVLIEAARKICSRLAMGSVDGEILIMESGLEEAIKPNLPKLGLRLADKQLRQQFVMGIGVGRSDLVCLDEAGDLVVLELKRGMSSDQVVGQILRYVGWLRENVAANGQQVKGMIVTGGYDEQLRLAAGAAGIRVVRARLA